MARPGRDCSTATQPSWDGARKTRLSRPLRPWGPWTTACPSTGKEGGGRLRARRWRLQMTADEKRRGQKGGGQGGGRGGWQERRRKRVGGFQEGEREGGKGDDIRAGTHSERQWRSGRLRVGGGGVCQGQSRGSPATRRGPKGTAVEAGGT